MRRVMFPLILSLLLAAVPASAGKVGFVDAERVISEVGEGKAKLNELQSWQTPYQKKLDSLREQILALSEQARAAAPEDIAEIEKNQIEVMRRFEDERREYERQLEKKKDQVLADITRKIAVIGKRYAEENGYDAIFVLGAQSLIYLSPSADLTDKVIEIYNQRHPVGGQ